jgi:hypothetical protein
MGFAPAVTLDGVVPEIKVPFLVTHGARDRQIPLAYAHAQYEAAVAVGQDRGSSTPRRSRGRARASRH